MALIDHAHAITNKGVVSSKLRIGLRRVRGRILSREDGGDKINRVRIVMSLAFPGGEIRVLRISWGHWPARICLAHLSLLFSIKLKHIGAKNSLTFDLLGKMDDANERPEC